VTGLLVDTFAWMEIFSGSQRGHRALACMGEHSPQAISVLTLYELQYLLGDLYGEKKTAALLATIVAQTEVLPLDSHTALAAGTIKAEKKRAGSGMGAVDCLILATARIHRLKILTGDRHFAGLEDVIEV